jgi:FkbM family methyltransferase
MKRRIKQAVGRCAISIASLVPWSRSVLRPIGLRASQDLFGQRIVSINSFGGQSFRLTHVDESYLAFQLFWHGGQYYEPISRAVLEALLRPEHTFLDLGAHVGFYSLAGALSVKGVKVIAFEPNPKNFRILQANVAANGLTGVHCEPLAISDTDGTATLYLTESDMSASLMKDFQAEDTAQIDSIEVPTVSLDSYVQRHGVRGPMLIKVDIEGHEPAFFRGASKTLAEYRPDIVLEVLYDQEPTLVSDLKSLGYHFYPITDQGLVEADTPKLVKRFPFLFLNYLLSVRPQRELAGIFSRVDQTIRGINLLQTSKHFPKEQWPCLWPDEPAPQSTPLTA